MGDLTKKAKEYLDDIDELGRTDKPNKEPRIKQLIINICNRFFRTRNKWQQPRTLRPKRFISNFMLNH